MISDSKVYQQAIKKVSVLGCGWFGFAFAKALIARGYSVNGSTTTETKLIALAEAKIAPYLVNFTTEKIEADPSFFECDALFICIPPKRNSAELQDYPTKIKLIIDAAKGKATQIVLISSTSVFADENQFVNEETPTCPDTDSGKVVVAAEEILKAETSEATIIRFAGLIGPDRNPGRFFAGKTDIPNGLAPVNLIHQTDAVGIAIRLIEKQAFGRIYHACSPSHPTKMDFYVEAAKVSGLAVPAFIAEKKTWKIVKSLNVSKYLDYGFEVGI
ncbi:NAD(P)-binding domain-containing protein [Pedobacter sp. HDW13]|uniref:NAD(P)-binding domain-containing protein n=1 Tax=Pedobacter sp. HDW13 TaxID=2714940 RepID=UPI001409C2BE|nr:NAD(P)-binding domain-containing protein [Pedobacter sp. HDW13]QIL40810.1 NAD(P)-binding domain-containing protein [Pedobacter sp. HDW13]